MTTPTDNKYVFVRTFGCQQNEADSEKLRGIAVSLGYKVTDDAKTADLILVNTCAIREHAELRALSIIGQYKHIKAAKPSLIIGVCGCMTAQPHRVEELKMQYPYVDFTLDPSEIEMLPEVIETVKQTRKRQFLIGASDYTIKEGSPVIREDKSRAWVSIMYGCNNFCSYCIVPYVRGRERSRSKFDILREVKELVNGGYKEITLLGQNVNSYHGECNFAQLLAECADIDGEFILRFMTSNPKDVTDELIDVIATHPKIARHYHLPMQSGSDRVLSLMNRKYNTAQYFDFIDNLREKIPDIAITSDIIVGFPSETEEDFSQTLAAVEHAKFDMVYSFIFSRRRGTPAFDMKEQIPQKVKKERFARLLALVDKTASKQNEKYVGRVCRVLVEGKSKNVSDTFTGRTDSNKIVHFSPDTHKAGEFVNIKIEEAHPFDLFGKII